MSRVVAVAGALGQIGNPEAVNELASLLEGYTDTRKGDAGYQAKLAIIRALGQTGQAKAAKILKQIINNKKEDVQELN